MNRTLCTWWTTALTAFLALLYAWIGLGGYGLDRVLGLAGAALVLAALLLARRSRLIASILLVSGTAPLAVAAWWSIAAPVVGLLMLLLGTPAIRAQTRRNGHGMPDRQLEEGHPAVCHGHSGGVRDQERLDKTGGRSDSEDTP